MRARWGRRLTDKLAIVFHQACDQGDFEVARQLLLILETACKRDPLVSNARRRHDQAMLVAAWERLWTLQHQDAEQQGPSEMEQAS